MEKKKPTGEQILSLLIDLLADQHGVKVKYHIEKEGTKEDEKSN